MCTRHQLVFSSVFYAVFAVAVTPLTPDFLDLLINKVVTNWGLIQDLVAQPGS